MQLDAQWVSVDSYINDRTFYERALERLKASGHPIGYSVSFIDGKSSCEFNFGEKGFVHMGAVLEDHGVWEDPAEYFASSKYLRFNAIQMMGYPMLARLANRNIERIRASEACGRPHERIEPTQIVPRWSRQFPLTGGVVVNRLTGS